MSTHGELFEILADPRRRQILDALRARELAVNALVDAIGIHQSGVSRHLGILLQAGFVTVRAEGSRRLYAVRLERFRELAAWTMRFLERRERRDRRATARGRA
jgi:DNA-binding transcriptional ArsR family regulator